MLDKWEIDSGTRQDLFPELTTIERQLTVSYFYCFIQYILMLDPKITLDAAFNHSYIYLTKPHSVVCHISLPSCEYVVL